MIKKANDIQDSWAMPFASGSFYNVHWRSGIDFNHLALAPKLLWEEDEGVVIRFNYTDNR